MEKLKSMKECLMSCAQTQMGNLQGVDTKELGEVIDMIKDLEEAIYYCTITKAMEEDNEHKNKESHHYYTERVIYPKDEYNRDIDREYGKMYYTPSNGGNSTTTTSSPRYYTEMTRDEKEGRSPIQRKMYIEAKEKHQDKATQLKELEKYMNELADDMTEMIADASPEERQFFERKLSQLATKISHV